MDKTEIKQLDREHHLHSWSIQKDLDPLVFEGGRGTMFWDADGKKYLDFSSQLMNLNTGHQHPKVVKAICEQAHKVMYCAPGMAYESRSELVKTLARICPGDLKYFFFTLDGAEANENAIKIARHFTGRFKILSRYRSYHGASYGAVSLSGDPRRPPVEPGIPGVVHVLDPYCYRCSFGQSYPGCNLECAKHIEEVILYENPDNVAALFMEGVTGSNGLIVPPPEYWPLVREICSKFGILLVSDEVMSGFGRTGEWFAVDHWDIIPDIMTMAKGITSGYLPLGAVAVNDKIFKYFQDNMLWSGLTYNAHPLSCASAVATVRIYDEENLIEKTKTIGQVLKEKLDALMAKHPSIGDVRGIGLFAVIELVKNKETKEGLVPWNASGSDLALSKAIMKKLLEEGLYTWVRWNLIFIVPPLIITEEELSRGLAIIDTVLDWVDDQL